MPLAAIPSEGDIVRTFHAGQLASELARFHEGDNGDALFTARCVALHNRGDIDLVAVPSQAAFGGVGGPAFFTAQHLYCQAIPQLKTTAVPLMECCRILVEKGGADLASNEPNRAFHLWCQSNPDEGAAVIARARAGDPLAKQFVTFALRAANDAAAAVDFIMAYPDERRLFGMAALGGMTFTDAETIQRSFETLEPYVADSADDRVRGNALISGFEVLKRGPKPEAISRLIGLASKDPGPETLHGLARILWSHRAMLSRDDVELILSALQAVNPANSGTIGEIDVALRHLLGTDKELLALDFLTTKLRDEKLAIENFSSVRHELASGDRQRLYEVVVRWFLSGSLTLCKNVPKLIGPEEDGVFDSTVKPLRLTVGQQIFLCRKAIGFLFVKPTVCCSILVSVLRGGDADAVKAATDYLFDPILINYGGSAKDYLKGVPPTDLAYEPVQAALARDKSFYADLDSVGTIKELHPSEYKRNVERQRIHDQMRDAQKLAESKSVFLNLVHRSTILYGKRSLTYVTDPDGNQRAVKMDLKPFSTFMEIPRHEIYDPVGLDYMLRIFRVEKFK